MTVKLRIDMNLNPESVGELQRRSITSVLWSAVGDA